MYRIAVAARIAGIASLLAFAPSSWGRTALEIWPAAAHEGRILVRLKEGRTIEAIGPVRENKGTLIIPLPSRALLFTRFEDVESILDAAPRSQAAPVDAPRVYGNADLPLVPKSGPAIVRESTQNLTAPEVPAIGPYAAYRDRNGHDESWWRNRMSRLTSALGATQIEIDRLEVEVRVARAQAGAPLHNINGIDYPGLIPLIPGRSMSSLDAQRLRTLEQALEDFEDARAYRVELQSEIDGLTEEARQADALPGWLR